jgi:mannan endo-1,4-beta-mannosidase
MHDRFTKEKGLHNLIWVYTGTDNKDWYPGDDVVDIVGVDTGGQEGDPISSLWEKQLKAYDGKKLLAVTEIGGVADIEKMHRFGVKWSYVASWNEGAKYASREMVIKTYQSPLALTFDDVKHWTPQKTNVNAP